MSHREQPNPEPQQGAAPNSTGTGTSDPRISSAPQAAARPAWAEPAGVSPVEEPAAPQHDPSAVSETVVTAVPEVTVRQVAADTVTEDMVTDHAVTQAEPVPMAEERPLGRAADEAVVAPAVQRTVPQGSPQERLRRQNWLGLGSRMVGGLVTLGVLLAALGSGWSWSSVLFVWVLLTILADEFGGWFGYIATFMGLLTLLLGNQPAEVWNVVLPLVGGALLALLVVKHSGGWGVLPFAGAVFALPIIAAAQYGHLLDENLLLVADPDLGRSAILAMLVGLGISLVRQFILWLVDLGRRRTERRLLRADQVPVRQA